MVSFLPVSAREPAVASVVASPVGPASAAIAAAIPRSHQAITPARKRLAIAIAALSDLAQWFFFPVLSEGAFSPFESGSTR